MIDKKLQAYRTYCRFLRILLTMSGCWYMPTKSGKSTCYWSVCLIFMTIMYLMINFRVSYINRHNLAIMIGTMGVVVSCTGTLLKVVIFLINRDSLINYHRTLNDLFEEELARNEKIRTIMFSYLPSVSNLAYIYFVVIITMVAAYYMPVYLVIFRDLCHFRLTTNYTLPMSKGYGYLWTVPDNFLYHFHMLYEMCTGSLMISTACSVDSVFGFYVYQFASTMYAMTFRLTNPLPSENFSDVLRTCVTKHQKLLRCRDTLEHIFGIIIFYHIITNAMILCAVIYEMVSFDFTIAHLFIFITYLMIKVLQTFIYSWYGSLLTNASEEFRKGIYFGEWPNSSLDRHVRTNIILIMMQEPMTINAFYSPVNAVLFTNFVNTTMSYFFLLQSIGNKDE